MELIFSLLHAELEVQSHLSKHHLSDCPHLNERLDYDNGGVDSDLIEIASKIPEWEEKLVVQLKLTSVQVSDIKARYPGNPELQRYVANNIQITPAVM